MRMDATFRSAASDWPWGEHSTISAVGRASTWVPMSRGIALALLATLLMTPPALGLHRILPLKDVGIAYLVPVVISAMRWGLVPALAAALAGVVLTAFLFYAPIYSFFVSEPQDVLNLTLFVLVAVITSKLAAAVSTHAEAAEQRGMQLQALYSFSRRLAAAARSTEIFAAIQEHLSAAAGTRAYVLMPTQPPPADLPTLPAAVQTAIAAARMAGDGTSTIVPATTDGGAAWLLRPLDVSLGNTVPPEAAPGMDEHAGDHAGRPLLVVELPGDGNPQQIARMRAGIDRLLDDAMQTLERLDVARTLAQAQMRSEREVLREALIGSVSHGLRTPLAAILGSASILARSPLVASEPRLASLARIVVSEAERLDGDIEKLLEAAKVSSAGIHPQLTWTEPADLIAATLDHHSLDLSAHDVHVDYAPDLPLVMADPSLIVQALRQIVGNAAHYSPAGCRIEIAVTAGANSVEIAVLDQGPGVDADEARLLTGKFYRGAQMRDTTRGSGLGLWIANAFVGACKGQLTIGPRPDGSGTRVALRLPAASEESMRAMGSDGE